MTYELEFWSAAFKANAPAHFAQLRADEPVKLIHLPHRGPVWLVSRYEEAMQVLKDPRFIKDWRKLTPEQIEQSMGVNEEAMLLMTNMLNADPPEHTRLRSLVHKAFTPRYLEQLRPRVQAITDELIDRVQARREMDLVEEFAFPLPITVISEMLGIPAELRDTFRGWVDTILIQDPGADPTTRERTGAATQGIAGLLLRLFEERRAAPTDDLIGRLVQVEEQGERLNSQELLAMAMVLLLGGYETTANLIGNGMLALLTSPEQLALLKARPELVESAVEEFLRFDSPAEFTTDRYTAEEVELGGVRIPSGATVLAVLSAANRDGQRFPEPDRLQIDRADNRHLAFGYGVHYCVGAPLARLEGQIAFSTLLARLPNLRLAADPQQLRWRPSIIVRGVEALPVTF
jgi:cytochrome P450